MGIMPPDGQTQTPTPTPQALPLEPEILPAVPPPAVPDTSSPDPVSASSPTAADVSLADNSSKVGPSDTGSQGQTPVPTESGGTGQAPGAVPAEGIQGLTLDTGSQGETLDASSETAQTVGNEPFVPPPVTVKRNDVREFLAMALEKIAGKKKKKLERIMAEIERTGKITNDQVQKLLHCSDATATRYLIELQRTGRIWRSGSRGRGVNYLKV